jgi:hypothetical protein
MNHILVLAALTPCLVFGACAHHRGSASSSASPSTRSDPPASFHLSYDSKRVAVGDLVTVNATSPALSDPDTFVEWDATPADIRTRDRGTTAYLTFKSPGKYTVTGRLIVNDHTEREERITFDVQPGRWPRPGRTAGATYPP